jgi:hypothetical protein
VETVAEATAKDRWERWACRRQRIRHAHGERTAVAAVNWREGDLDNSDLCDNGGNQRSIELPPDLRRLIGSRSALAAEERSPAKRSDPT